MFVVIYSVLLLFNSTATQTHTLHETMSIWIDAKANDGETELKMLQQSRFYFRITDFMCLLGWMFLWQRSFVVVAAGSAAFFVWLKCHIHTPAHIPFAWSYRFFLLFAVVVSLSRHYIFFRYFRWFRCSQTTHWLLFALANISSILFALFETNNKKSFL